MNKDLFCCCFRQNQVACSDPSIYYIYLGINALKISNSKHLIIADFGSSYGQNSIQTINIILDYLKKTNKLRQSPLIIHNDLPTNDWTNFFQNLPNNSSYYNLANGRSFYEQCLPTNSLSIGYSSASLHYLSAKPCNIINHCYIHFADENEREIFQKQSKYDWDLFLQHRSRELISGGILILNIPSIKENEEMGFNRYFHWIYQCAEVFLTNELRDFTLPFYLRSLSECIDIELFARYSLKLIQIELIRLKSPLFSQYQTKQITFNQFSKSLVRLMQSSIQSILKQTLENHGRSNEEINTISTQFWNLFEEKIRNESHDNDVNIYSTYLILKKK